MIRTKKDLKEYISTERALWLRCNFPAGNPQHVKSKELDFVESLRYMEYYGTWPKKKRILGGVRYFFHRWRYKYLSEKWNVSIPLYVFEKGLMITHLQNIVVSNRVKVGRYCRLFHNTTLGIKLGRKTEKERTCPIIGDGVTICTGAVVVGGIDVADGVMIGANAVVSHSVPDRDVVVAGIPAHIRGRNSGFSMLELKNSLELE